jgi:hypothetical protein
MKTLWRDEAGGRHYLVPADAELPPGALLLRSGAARTASVDPAAVAAYAVSKEDAREFLDARLEAWAAQTKGALAEAFSLIAETVDDGEGEMPGAPPTVPLTGFSDEQSGDAEPGPGVQLFSALSGEPAQTVGSDPEAFMRGLATLLGEAAALMSRAAEGPEGEAEARERLRQLGDTLRAHGIAPPSQPPDRDAN